MTENSFIREKTFRHLMPNSVRDKMQINQTWSVMGESFELESKYKVIDYLGAGAYGVVCAAQDTTESCVVAIKKCKKIFQSRTLAKRTLRELRLLRLLDHENIVKIRSVLKPLDCDMFTEIYIVFEIMETDLAQIIRSPQTLKDQHVQYFTYQLLLSLRYLHAAKIVHRDLKPRNLLVNGDCCLKVADFGLARVYNDKNDSKILAMTEYVTTRWYRAPEVLVGWHRYTTAVDLWAVGCIMAELIGRMPLFPGQDSMKQLELICRFSGKPSEEFIRQSRKASCRQFLNELPNNMKPTDVRNLYPGANPLALDLVEKLLDFNPQTRISAEEALSHPYIQPMLLRASRKQPENLIINDFEFSFEEKKLTVDDIRVELLSEVNGYLPKPMSSSHDRDGRGKLMIQSKNEIVTQDGALAALATAAAMLQEKEQERDGALKELEGDLVNMTGTQSKLQPQSSGHTTEEACTTNLNNSNGSKSISAGALMITPTSNLNGDREEVSEQTLATGNKRGRLDTTASFPTGVQEEEKMTDNEMSVMSDKMKALSTFKCNYEINKNIENIDMPDYVRRGAKRASIADRPSFSITVDSKPEDENEEEDKNNMLASRLSKSVTVFSPNHSAGLERRPSWTNMKEQQKVEERNSKGRRLYSCLGEESTSEDQCSPVWSRRTLPRKSDRLAGSSTQRDQCIIL